MNFIKLLDFKNQICYNKNIETENLQKQIKKKLF